MNDAPAGRTSVMDERQTAIAAAEQAQYEALASEEIADLAQGVSRDADLTASKARHSAMRARRLATKLEQESTSAGDGGPTSDRDA